MNAQLQNALRELKALKARGVPSGTVVEKAKNKTSWNGDLADGGTWKLIKHGEDSYTTNTRQN
ncbi:MAG: hypothetical protein A2821_01700 [Candidatus Magasanikbacteria bacterium RIFCSPHIGHO2_01_FULL_41_23]|uniref:Uncharacterized protein n=1 Tax=Candidatus Magasanikbacteria bacterium RIFCSPLOWO2_01_FULL_40_15 TaxID=1798686 RepID=A0A1F6N345_9BACT|nr:MAG: hypothetical protein A2821_01700 [Candidatus Magasanikbacteria bacterium RIFCSPHIGHO2_01_FULL_41_23]OGH75038.1 MAG: hypothetical protein A3F22_00410 [Candidatus Magasanikbacteria bacterium RIFCSPHIGHO2_12_FULL_41_16]OGH78292.1 MAG: hypothetical protein A2983_04015 [Candidatus Magasanikbacteria bacterium RIFCSPLOWO2_01_FULL_40_15]